MVIFGFGVFRRCGVCRATPGGVARYLHFERRRNVRTVVHLVHDSRIRGAVVRDNHDDQTVLVYSVVVLDFHAPVDVHAMARDRDGFRIVVLPSVFEKSASDERGDGE